MNYYNRNAPCFKFWQDFFGSMNELGWCLLYSPYYHKPTGVLGIEPPEMEYWNLDVPWWFEFGLRVGRVRSTCEYIYRCLDPRSGWCHYDEPRYNTRIWYTFKALICLVLLPWKGSNTYNTVEVAAWNLGSDYFGEAQGDTLEVGRGIFRNWFARKGSV